MVDTPAVGQDNIARVGEACVVGANRPLAYAPNRLIDRIPGKASFLLDSRREHRMGRWRTLRKATGNDPRKTQAPDRHEVITSVLCHAVLGQRSAVARELGQQLSTFGVPDVNSGAKNRCIPSGKTLFRYNPLPQPCCQLAA